MSLINPKNEYDQQCRTCLQEALSLHYIHDIVTISDIDISLAQAISLCTSVEVDVDDKLPQYLCEVCKNAIFSCYEFRILCEKSDKILKTNLLEVHNINVTGGNPNKLLLENSELDPLIDSKEDKSLIIDVIDSNTEEHLICISYEDLKDDAVVQNVDKITPIKNKPISNKTKATCEKEKYEDVTDIPKNDSSIETNTCDECGKVFRNRTYMLKHKKRHTSLSICVYCQYVTTIPSKLAEHMQEQHFDKKDIECKDCGKKFFKKRNLQRHELVHSGVKSHTCEVCGLSFALKGNFNAHKRIHTGERPYICSTCGKGFAQYSGLRSHLISHSTTKEHVCSECGVAFTRWETLVNHKKRHQDSRPFACSQCKKAFRFKNDLTRHILTHTGVRNYACEYCDKRFNRNSHLHVHRRTHTGETPHVCTVCGRGFIQAHVLRTHLKTHKK